SCVQGRDLERKLGQGVGVSDGNVIGAEDRCLLAVERGDVYTVVQDGEEGELGRNRLGRDFTRTISKYVGVGTVVQLEGVLGPVEQVDVQSLNARFNRLAKGLVLEGGQCCNRATLRGQGHDVVQRGVAGGLPRDGRGLFQHDSVGAGRTDNGGVELGVTNLESCVLRGSHLV